MRHLFDAVNAQQTQINALMVVLKTAISFIVLGQEDREGLLKTLRTSAIYSAANLTLTGDDVQLNERNRAITIRHIEDWFDSIDRSTSDSRQPRRQ
jgi:hypothetical protein